MYNLLCNTQTDIELEFTKEFLQNILLEFREKECETYTLTIDYGDKEVIKISIPIDFLIAFNSQIERRILK